MQRIYLDYNASTPVDRAVADAMRPFLAEQHGNPFSGHRASVGAKEALEKEIDTVLARLNCLPAAAA